MTNTDPKGHLEMPTTYTTKRDAIEREILPALGEYADDYDIDKLAKKAQMLVLDNSKYNYVEQPMPSTPHEAIERALSTIKSAPRI